MVLVSFLMAPIALFSLTRLGLATGRALVALVLASSWWGIMYGLELQHHGDQDATTLYGALKYVGVVALAPTWLLFVLMYTGHDSLITKRTHVVLAFEPLVVLTLLAIPDTRWLIREVTPTGTIVSGPIFWIHMVYSLAMSSIASLIFLHTAIGMSKAYRRHSIVMITSVVVPWVLNIGFNLQIGWLGIIDLTPVGFAISGVLLLFGLLRFTWLRTSAPFTKARGVVDLLDNGIIVMDAFRIISDANPAALNILNQQRHEIVGVPISEVIPGRLTVAPRGPVDDTIADDDIRLHSRAGLRNYHCQRRPMTDKTGSLTGEVLVLCDTTDQQQHYSRLSELDARHNDLAEAFIGALSPSLLPSIVGVELAIDNARADQVTLLCGEFLDVFRLSPFRWVAILGNVHGTGVPAAALAVRMRDIARTLLIDEQDAVRALIELNQLPDFTTKDAPQYCSVGIFVFEVTVDGLHGEFTSAGHHPPLIVRADGTIESTGSYGPALGLAPSISPTSTDLILSIGDTMCMFGDGTVTASQDDQPFGVGQVSDILCKRRQEPLRDTISELGQQIYCHQKAGKRINHALLGLRVVESTTKRPETTR